jgi:PAS domain-containing protein
MERRRTIGHALREQVPRTRRATEATAGSLNRAQPGRDAEGPDRSLGRLSHGHWETWYEIEQALRESKERLAGIVSTAIDAIITVDEDQRIVLFNEAAERRMFGCTAAEAMGRNDSSASIPECFRRAHPDNIRRFRRNWRCNAAGQRRLSSLTAFALRRHRVSDRGCDLENRNR